MENKKLIKTYLNFKNILKDELKYISKIKNILNFNMVAPVHYSLMDREKHLLKQIEIIDSNIKYLLDKEE